jgi:hypothetical protein
MDAITNLLVPFFSPSGIVSFGASAALIWFAIQWPGVKLKVLAAACAAALIFHGVGYVRGDHAGAARITQQWEEANERRAAAEKKRDDAIAAAALKAATEALAEIENLSKEQLERITQYAAELARGRDPAWILTDDDFRRLRSLRDAGAQRRGHR